MKQKKKKYLLDNSEYIFSYFEKKNDMTKGKTKTKILHSFFSKEKEKDENKSNKFVKKYLSNVDESFLNINDYKITHDVEYLKTHFMNTKVDVETYKTKEDFETSVSGIKTMRFNDYFDQMGDRTYVPDCSLIDLSKTISTNIFFRHSFIFF